jgi:hypothetical protein
VLADCLGHDVSDIAISVTNWPVFYIAIQNFLKPFLQDFVCVRANFIRVGLASVVLVISIKNQRDATWQYVY